MNKVILTGNICKDIELTETSNDKKLLKNTIAVRRDFKDSDGEYTSDFIDFVCWNKQAEFIEKYGCKGDLIEIIGHWSVRTYERDDGSKRNIHECMVESIRILISRKPSADEAKPEAVQELIPLEEDNGDLPF